jgi:hypothetical protein
LRFPFLAQAGQEMGERLAVFPSLANKTLRQESMLARVPAASGLPCAVLGPVDFLALRWLAAIFAGEAIFGCGIESVERSLPLDLLDAL